MGKINKTKINTIGILIVLAILGVSPALAYTTVSEQRELAGGYEVAAQQRQSYTQTNLTSDIPGLAKITDPNLVNSWGITHPPTGPWWVSDNGPGLATLYNGSGVPFPVGNRLIVTIPGINGPGTPTGVVFNAGNDFNITPGNASRFIFATEDGTIAAWNPNVDRLNAIQVVNNSPEAVYKGLAIAFCSHCGHDMLYVANFREGKIDVFDTNFTKVAHGGFVDNTIPQGFAPFNVLNVGGNLVVTYAKQDAAKHDDVAGPGNGFVDIFDPHGNLIKRLRHGFWLNSPWGVAKAPANFGQFSNLLLIGNFGSGKIAGFDDKGNFRGLLRDNRGQPITIDGLWGLGFGNDATAGPSNTLFFAAGLNGEQDGLFGTITK